MSPPLRLPWALALVVTCALVNGPAGALIGLCVVVALRRGASGRHLLAAAVATLALAAVANLLVGLPDRLAISATFATDRLLAHHLAFGGAVLLVVGVLVDVAADRVPSVDEP